MVSDDESCDNMQTAKLLRRIKITYPTSEDERRRIASSMYYIDNVGDSDIGKERMPDITNRIIKNTKKLLNINPNLDDINYFDLLAA